MNRHTESRVSRVARTLRRCHAAAAAVAMAFVLIATPAWAQKYELPKELTSGELLPVPAKPGDAPAASPATNLPAAPAAPTLTGPSSVTPETIGPLGDAPLETDPQHIVALWNQHWRVYARRFVALDGDYAALATFDPRYPSSAGTTVSQAIRQNTESVRVSSGNLSRTVAIKPDRDDVEPAAKAIPDIKVGEYGWIDSAKVDEVLGPDAMVVSAIWLLDAEAVTKQKAAELARVPELQKPPKTTNRQRTRSFTSGRNRFGNSGNSAQDLQRQREQRAQQEYQALNRARDAKIKQIDDSYEMREKMIKAQSSGNFAGPLVLRGFSTAGARAGQRWDGERRGEGAQIAVVMVEQPKRPDPKADDDKPQRTRRFGLSIRPSGASRAAGGRRLVAVPALTFRTVALSEQQFIDMLAKRGLSPAQFVNLVIKVKKASPFDPSNPRLEEPGVFDELEKRRGQGETAAPADDKQPTG